MSSTKNNSRVLLFLPPGAESYEAAAFIDVFGWNEVCGAAGCTLTTCSFDYEVPLSFGQSMRAQSRISTINPADFNALALPGGFGRFGYYENASQPLFTALLQHFMTQNKSLAAVCTAPILLAQNGLLQGRRATCYQQEACWPAQLRKHGAVFIDAPLVEDGNLISSQNPHSAIPVALHLLARLTNRANADQIALLMGFAK